MITILGLGNPGPKYRNTRHNLGFLVLDELARRWSRTFTRSHPLFEKLQKTGDAEPVLLIKPLTFMNRSGEVLRNFPDDPEFHPEKLLVILDDFALPLGKIRIRRKGSDGGHNGLASVIRVLGHSDFPRLRLGIGLEENRPVTDYVLSPFAGAERPLVSEMIQRGADAALDFLEQGIHHTMNLYN